MKKFIAKAKKTPLSIPIEFEDGTVKYYELPVQNAGFVLENLLEMQSMKEEEFMAKLDIEMIKTLLGEDNYKEFSEIGLDIEDFMELVGIAMQAMTGTDFEGVEYIDPENGEKKM